MALSLPHTLEALLFAAGEPLTKKRISTLLSVPEDMLNAAIAELRDMRANSGLALMEVGDELELRTSAEAAPVVETYQKSELSKDLGKAGLEALAIILYQKGATRGDIDWIRGVNSTAAIRSLLLRGLIERSADTEDKRRVRYTASVDALAHLGLRRYEDLPDAQSVTQKLTDHHAKNEHAL